MTYTIGDVIEVNTADVTRGSGHEHMLIISDAQSAEDDWWAFFFSVSEEDLERLLRRAKMRLKVISVEADARIVSAEAPQSPPELRYYSDRIHALHPMGFKSQGWGRYSWLE